MYFFCQKIQFNFSSALKYNIAMKKIIKGTIAISALAAALPLAAYSEYRKTFYVRMAEPTGFIGHYFKVHPALLHKEFCCLSDKGDLIRGLLLSPSEDPRALIVMTHGYNMSCENYMPLARRFTEAGFQVLMFDGIGVGMSGGDKIYGLPQHILDMKTVLDAVQADPELSRLPLLLFGHSWGGYAACCVSALSHYPLKGILTCAAFRKSSSAMIPSIRKRYPLASPVFVTAAEVMERLLFGRVASLTSSEGLRQAGCPARLYHSRDDAVVGFEESFETTRRELADEGDIGFIAMNGRNHDLYIPPDNDRRQREILKELRSADGPAKSALTEELWELLSATDNSLADEFVSFFNSCIK